MPKRGRPFCEGDQAIEDRTDQRRNCDFGPHHVDVHAADLRRDSETHAHDRSAEELGDDRPDECQRRIDLERVEDERRRSR